MPVIKRTVTQLPASGSSPHYLVSNKNGVQNMWQEHSARKIIGGDLCDTLEAILRQKQATPALPALLVPMVSQPFTQNQVFRLQYERNVAQRRDWPTCPQSKTLYAMHPTHTDIHLTPTVYGLLCPFCFYIQPEVPEAWTKPAQGNSEANRGTSNDDPLTPMYKESGRTLISDEILNIALAMEARLLQWAKTDASKGNPWTTATAWIDMASDDNIKQLAFNTMQEFSNVLSDPTKDAEGKKQRIVADTLTIIAAYASKRWGKEPVPDSQFPPHAQKIKLRERSQAGLQRHEGHPAPLPGIASGQIIPAGTPRSQQLRPNPGKPVSTNTVDINERIKALNREIYDINTKLQHAQISKLEADTEIASVQAEIDNLRRMQAPPLPATHLSTRTTQRHSSEITATITRLKETFDKGHISQAEYNRRHRLLLEDLADAQSREAGGKGIF